MFLIIYLNAQKKTSLKEDSILLTFLQLIPQYLTQVVILKNDQLAGNVKENKKILE